ncbi:MAG: sensor histidine kinase [Nocardioides sp.]|nr:sensor histidine kinase [Nocardioides sp.]
MPNTRENAPPGAFLSVFHISEWPVRRKVVAVLAIPVILATVFGALRVSSALRAAGDYSTNQQRATVLGPTIDYLNATERLALPSSLADRLGDGTTSPEDSYAAASSNLKKAASEANLTDQQAGLIDSMMQIGDTLATGTGTGITATAPVQLGDMNRLTTQVINSTLNARGTPDTTVQALIQSLNSRLSLVKQQLLIQSADQRSSLLGSMWLAAEIGVEGQALDNIKALVGGSRTHRLIALNGTRLGLATDRKAGDLAATPRMFTTYDRLEEHMLTGVEDKLAANASNSKRTALVDAGVIILAILASLLLALLVARTLIRPLRKVRVGALEVANAQLPRTVARIRDGQEPEEITPIPVHTGEELGQLARAVDDMHRQAVHLASGEAQLRSQVGAMFVTLSRRNTTLVNQQLALIESLEQDEEDPQRLEQLFNLDHLATRMRRTAESLVILGGTSGRTASFEELSVSDVIHAAVSEVQDYQRVRIDAAPDRMIVGRAGSDLVHLMAELIDNALQYSPPGSPVTIHAADEGSGVVIEILDNGLGMAGDALAAANDSLRTGGEVTVDTARRMGLFVVSRLAQEHGLEVSLRRNAGGGGIIATVRLPFDVLVSDGPVQHVSAMDTSELPKTVAPVVHDEPDEDYDPYLERIEEAISAVTGLPRRRPGQTSPGREPVPTPAAGFSMFDPLTNPVPLSGQDDAGAGREPEPETVAWVVSAHGDGVRRETADGLAETPEAEATRHEPPARHDFHSWEVPDEQTPAPAYHGHEDDSPPTGPQAGQPVSGRPQAEEPAVRLRIRRPLSAGAAAAALEGDYVADDVQSEAAPIFGQLRSNWLHGDSDASWSGNEVDRGWDAAERAESTESDGTTRAGLPVRRPGERLVPGGVSQEPAKVVRDPEAIRNRLAAHAAGVSRGRAASTGQPTKDDYAHKENGPS